MEFKELHDAIIKVGYRINGLIYLSAVPVFVFPGRKYSPFHVSQSGIP